jgi:hypothetical protein
VNIGKWKLADQDGTGVVVVPAGCRSVTVRGEPKVHAAVVSALVPGGLLLSIAMFAAGVARVAEAIGACRRRAFLAETIIVFTIPITLSTGLVFEYREFNVVLNRCALPLARQLQIGE